MLENRFSQINIQLSPVLSEYLAELDHVMELNSETVRDIKEKLNAIFCDPCTTIYIPAGRSIVALLSDQLDYIFWSLDVTRRLQLDYSMLQFVATVQKLRAQLPKGVEGILADKIGLSGQINATDSLYLAKTVIARLLHGNYECSSVEMLRLGEGKSACVKLAFSSAEQQALVWFLNILFYYLTEESPACLIVEQPEMNVFESNYELLAYLLALFKTRGNSVIVTVNSSLFVQKLNSWTVRMDDDSIQENSK